MCPSSDPDSEYNMGCILYQVSEWVEWVSEWVISASGKVMWIYSSDGWVSVVNGE